MVTNSIHVTWRMCPPVQKDLLYQLQSHDFNFDFNFKTSHLDTLSSYPQVLTCIVLKFDKVLLMLCSQSRKSSVEGDISVVGYRVLYLNKNYSMYLTGSILLYMILIYVIFQCNFLISIKCFMVSCLIPCQSIGLMHVYKVIHKIEK